MILEKIAVGIIGATGAVGQRFVQMLAGHPWFSLELVVASEKSAGKKYNDIVNWTLSKPMPDEAGELTVRQIDPNVFQDSGVRLLFSALPATVAKNVEPELAAKGFFIFSNASANRMVSNVPLLIGDINPEHIALVELQRQNYAKAGYIITNPNCSVVGLATALKPLVDNFQLTGVIATTYQALSGAGYPGVPSMDIVGNVIPYIPNEEEKVEVECSKILGGFTQTGIEPLPLDVIANCSRVPVRDGHLEAVVVDFESSNVPNVDEIKDVLRNFNRVVDKELPTAPDKPIIVTDDEYRPQPKLDLNSGTPGRAKGMAVTVGRLKIINNKLRLYLLVHNTIRGAAGCSIMNAELTKVEGYL